MLGWVNITYMIGDSLMINFALGCVAFLVYSQIRNVSIKPLIAIGMIALLIVIGIINAQHQAYRLFSFGITSFAIVMIALYTKLPDIEKSKTETICVYLGNASYSIYLFHLYVVFASEKIYSIVPLQKDVTGAIMSFVAVIMGCIFYTFIEKPLNSIIHGRVYRRLHA
ncbi:acyltransferase family protein [Enterobacter roggenkampii]|uniref:acyltransferase family protein n=1 Tax=Enterobacter roggenkampii TaxID=1812935 RepID=UPI003B75B5E2